MLTSLAILLLGSVPHLTVMQSSMPVPVMTDSYSDAEWKAAERTRLHKFAPICAKILHKQKRLGEYLDDPDLDGREVLLASDYLWYGMYGCPRNRALATDLIDRYVERNPFGVPRDAVEQAARLWSYSSNPEHQQRGRQLAQIYWVRGGAYLAGAPMPVWSVDEVRALLARDDVWAYLSKERGDGWLRNGLIAQALLDPLSPRYDPAKGVAHVEAQNVHEYYYAAARFLLDGRVSDNAAQRGEALLQKAADTNPKALAEYLELLAPHLGGDDPAASDLAAAKVLTLLQYGPEAAISARHALLPYYTARLSNADADVASKTASQLAQFYRDGTKTAEVPLLPWLDKQLRSGNDLQKSHSLATLSMLDSTGARALIDAEVTRAGGAIDFGLVGEAQGLRRNFIGSDDYPPRGLQSGAVGIVAARLLIAPNGRAILGDILSSAGAMLDATVIQTAMRRVRLKFPQHAGRYVWVRLPDVQFRLPACDTGDPVTPLQTGAVLVEGYCRPKLVYDLPVAIN